jgi:sacsin
MYNDQAFDFPTAILFSRLAPDAVQEVCNILRPPALIKLSTEVMSRMRTEKVELKTLDAKFVKELLLTDGGAEIIRETLVHEALEELLVFVSEGDGNNLLGLPLLYLQDETWTRFQSGDTSRHYNSLSTHEYVKNGLFPANRFVHSQFFPSQKTQVGSLLLEILLKSNVNVENLDSGALKQLTEERLASMPLGDKNTWIMSFWRTYPFFPPQGLNKSMESLPLVPTWNGTAYKSFLELKNNSALLIDRHMDHPESLQGCLDDLGIHVIALDTRFPSTLHLLLESSEYAATGPFFHRFLACLCPIVDNAIARFRSWPTQRQSTFADWVRSQVYLHPATEEGNIRRVARKLPVWRARKGTEETLCPAHQVQLLPYRLPLEVGCFSTTFRTSDSAVQHLGVQRTTIAELHRRLTIPNVLDEGEKEDIYKVLVRNYIDSDYSEHIIMPNADRRMVDCEDIFERSAFFQAAFGESSPRFLLRSFAIFERDIYSMGLRREQDLNLPLFRQCAQALHNDPSPAHEKLERAQIIYRFYCETLPLQVSSGHGAQWHDLDRIRFIPRNPNQVRRRGHTSEIELPLHIRQLPSLVSPGEVVQERFLEIAWTQRVALQTEPAQRLLVAFPDFGCPTGPEVVGIFFIQLRACVSDLFLSDCAPQSALPTSPWDDCPA